MPTFMEILQRVFNLNTSQLSVAGKAEWFDVTLSLDTNQYADGDVLAASQEIANFFLEEGGMAMVLGVQVLDEDDQGVGMDLLLLQADTNIGNENAAYDITDAEARNILGWVDVNAADFTDWGGFRTAEIRNGDTGFKCPTQVIQAGAATKSLWIAAISRGGTPTYTAAGLRVRIGVMYP